MKKIGVMALLVLISACGSGKFESEAIRATVVLDPGVKATCVLLEARDPADDRVLGESWATRAASDNELRIAVFKGKLPTDVKLAARPYLDGNCENGTAARTPNGIYVTGGTTSFVKGQVVNAEPLTLQPGMDGDGDGYVGTGAGGADCNDGADTVNPGAVEACTDQGDLNCDNRPGCQASTCAAQSCFGPPASITLTVPTPLTAGVCVSGGTVEFKDAAGVPSRPSVGTSVSLASPNSRVGYYSDAACTTSVQGVTVAANTSSASFFVQGHMVGTEMVTAAAAGLTAGTQLVTINPGTGNRLAFLSPARTAIAGVCSLAVQVQSRDAQNNPSPVTAVTTIGLAANPSTDFKFYSDASCNNEVTSVPLNSGASEASFFFKGTKAGSVNVTVTASNFAAASQMQTISAAPPSVIAFAGPVTVQAATCSPAISAMLRDPFGNPATAGAATQINLTSGGAPLSIFSNSTCTTAATSVTVQPGTGSRDFFVSATQANTYTVTASGQSLTNGTVNVTVTPGPATVLAFTSPAQSPQAGVCSGPVTVVQRDANANPVTVTTATTVNLSINPSQGFQFFTDSNCAGTAGTTATIAAGSSSATFYFRGTKTVTGATLTASVNTLTANQSVTITAGLPSVLVFTQLPATSPANGCMQVTLQVQDSFGNPSPITGGGQAVALTATPTAGFTFHTNTSCGTATTQVTVATGQSSVSFSARGLKSGSVSVSAMAGGLTTAAQSVNITPLPASKLIFVTPARRATAGDCSEILTVQASDTHDNPSSVGANEAVALSHTGTPADSMFRFYSDPVCNNTVTSITIPAGGAQASFYFRGEMARGVTVTADAASFPAITQVQSVVGANASSLVFSSGTPPGTVLVGDCSTVRTVEGFDAFGNTSTNALTVALSATPQAEFFSDDSCTLPISQVPIAASTNSASFYFKGRTGGINVTADLTLTASASVPLTATQTEALVPTVRTGTCTINAGTKDTTCIIAPALLNIGRAFLVFQATTTNTSSGEANVRCFINGTAQVRCEQGANATAAVNIPWSVAEFPSNPSVLPGVSVQHKPVNCGNDTTATSLTAVVRDRAFLLLSSRRNVNSQDSAVPRLAELTTTTEAQIRKMGGCGGGPPPGDTNHLQVVDYPGAVVQRGVTNLLAGSTNQQVGLSPAVDTSRSILLYSWISDGSGNKICDRVLRGDITPDGQNIRFSRGEGDTANCASSVFSSISWETVQFPAGTVVQQVTQQLAAGMLEADVTINAVDRSRTVVIAGGQWASGQVHGEGRHSTSELISEMRARATLTNSTTLRLNRETANASATFTVYVVQLKP